ncbi:MAG: hypothetical protein HY713_12075 [candidate division NC10 bacterium]|nr:hypothetical protein [candidate division NC10 bacterium]
MLIAIGPAILTRAFPASQRGQALGILASGVYIGLTVGPGLGGTIAFIVTLFSLVLALSRGAAWGWTSRLVVIAGAASAASAILFCSDRIGSRVPTVAGMACLATGMWLLGHLGVEGRDQPIVLRLGLVGRGIGLFTTPNNSAIMGGVSLTHQGLGSGIVATARTMGNVLGVAVSGSLFGAEVLRLRAVLGQEPLAVTGAYRHALTIGAGIALAGALTSLVRGVGFSNEKPTTDNRPMEP